MFSTDRAAIRLGVAASVLLCCVPVRAEEKFNRGLVAVVNSDGKAYIRWRLLKGDPVDAAHPRSIRPTRTILSLSRLVLGR